MFRGRNAFSIIEVILASTIIAVVVMASVNMLPNTSLSLRADRDMATQEHEARNVLEYVRSLGFNTLRDACADFGNTAFDAGSATVRCTIAAGFVDGEVKLQSPDVIGSDMLLLHVNFWALDPSNGNLIAVHTEDDLYAAGGATMADVGVATADGNPLYRSLMSQEDSIEGSNYEIIVEGRVVDDAGVPLSGVEVYMAYVDEGPIIERTLTTNSTGLFTTRVPRGLYMVVAEKEGYYMPPIGAVFINESNPFVLEIVLERRTILTGVIKDDKGNPVSGVEVKLQRSTGETITPVTTDASGFFRVQGLPLGTYQITLSKEWHETKQFNKSIQSHPHAELTESEGRLERRFRVQGRVTDIRGSYVSGAVVEFNGPSKVSVSTDSSGNYRLDNMRPGNYQITVSKDGGTNGWRTHTNTYTIDSDHPITTIDFELDYRIRVTGTVKDDLGANVSGATVTLQGTDIYNTSRTYTAKTSGNGTYSIENIIPGTYTPRSSLTGYVQQTLASRAINTHPTTINFSLHRRIVLQGTVRDSSGNPVPGVLVQLYQGSTYTGKSATTLTNGSYSISDVVPGVYNVRFEKAGYETATRSSFNINSHPTTTLNQTIKKLVTVQGNVKDTTGKNIQGATVTFTGNGYTTTATTNSSGNYTLSPTIATGSYSYTVKAPGYEELKGTFNVTQDPTTANFTIKEIPWTTVRTENFSNGSGIQSYGGTQLGHDISHPVWTSKDKLELPTTVKRGTRELGRVDTRYSHSYSSSYTRRATVSFDNRSGEVLKYKVTFQNGGNNFYRLLCGWGNYNSYLEVREYNVETGTERTLRSHTRSSTTNDGWAWTSGETGETTMPAARVELRSYGRSESTGCGGSGDRLGGSRNFRVYATEWIERTPSQTIDGPWITLPAGSQRVFVSFDASTPSGTTVSASIIRDGASTLNVSNNTWVNVGNVSRIRLRLNLTSSNVQTPTVTSREVGISKSGLMGTGTARTIQFDSGNSRSQQVLLTVDQTVGPGQSIIYEVSNNNGSTWTRVTPGTITTLPSSGRYYTLRITFQGSGGDVPSLQSYTLKTRPL